MHRLQIQNIFMAFITMNGDVNDHIIVVDVNAQIKVGFSPILYSVDPT